jgi:hypothetical protein
MKTTTVPVVYILLFVITKLALVQCNVRDFINRIFRRDCNGFVIHQVNNNATTIPLVDGMIIRPNEIPQWDIEARCTAFLTFRVEIVLTDKTTGEILRVGDDRTKRNGNYS